MLPITKALLTNRITRPYLRSKKHYHIRKLKGIVAHWTANYGRGADAMANRNYFNTTNVFASAHYIVDDHSVVQCLPDHEVGYHVGGKYYRPVGESLRENGLTPNYFVIGFEMCVNRDGDWSKTYHHSVELAQHLLNKYNFTINNLYRHHDITGKDCPKMMIEEDKWQAFRRKVNAGLEFKLENPLKKGYCNTSRLNVRAGNGSSYKIVGTLRQDDPVEIYETLGKWYRIGMNKWVHSHYIKITYAQKKGVVDVDDPSGLNVRSGPGSKHPIMDVVHDGQELEIVDQDGNWYQVGPSRWVHSRYVRLLEIRTGKVIAPHYLNVRKGPGTNYSRVRQVKGGSLVKVYEEKNGWYRIEDDEWVYGVFVEII